MTFLPTDRMWECVNIAREDSDTSLFSTLLHFGEVVTKITVAGLVAAVADDEGHRYRQIYRLVRADGLGEWDQVLDDILTGPASQFLSGEASEEKRQLIQKMPSDSWQHEAATHMYNCLQIFDIPYELPSKIDARKWFSMFVRLRNKTKGHGAPQANIQGKACPHLEKAIKIMIDEFALFKREWVYLHRNYSSKYRVTPLAQSITHFTELKQNKTFNLNDGIYVFFGERRLVDLMRSDPDASDLYFANGGVSGKKNMDYLSYITGKTLNCDISPYLTPPLDLPSSETQGKGLLDIQGNSWSNLPPSSDGYISRPSLEEQLHKILVDDRHPVVTLVGRGGIGKTHLALTVLHKIALEEFYEVIVWFSARDRDLLTSGPKDVKPHVLTSESIAKEFVRLMEPSEAKEKDFKTSTYFTKALTSSPTGKPILFVFDNFETVRSPIDLYNWIDTYIRIPNKVLITTRSRDFKGDYPVEVGGMTETECKELIDATSQSLGILSLLTTSYRGNLYQESDGHPYVIKILLGEVAKSNKIAKVERIIASKDEMLDALFERTYSLLSPVAKRVFLTLCNWKSVVPQIAIEAVLLRPSNPRMEVEAGIDELARSSFIEISTSNKDSIPFLIVPLVASIFGQRKLAVDQIKSAIDSDTRLLQALGAAQQSDIRHGIDPRIRNMFRHVSDIVKIDNVSFDDYVPIFEFIARRYSLGWLYLAFIYEEKGPKQNLDAAKSAIKRYLETADGTYDEQRDAWDRLAKLCWRTNDFWGEVHALLQISLLPNSTFQMCSDAVNRLNALFNQEYTLDTEEKRIVGTKLAEVMANRINEGDATDCSRLAWLYLHLGNEKSAREYTVLGLEHDIDNTYCLRLAEKLSIY